MLMKLPYKLELRNCFELIKECFGDEILWVDWRRPGFQLGLDIAKMAKENPAAKGVILGGHGVNVVLEGSWAALDTVARNTTSVRIIGVKLVDERGRAHLSDCRGNRRWRLVSALSKGITATCSALQVHLGKN